MKIAEKNENRNKKKMKITKNENHKKMKIHFFWQTKI